MTARQIMIEAWTLRQGVSRGIAAVEVDALLGIIEIAGYAVVPKEPTADMLVEGNLVIARNRLFATEIYKAMLTAARQAAGGEG